MSATWGNLAPGQRVVLGMGWMVARLDAAAPIAFATGAAVLSEM